MTPKDCFGVVVRTTGLLVILFGLYALLSSMYVLLTPTRPHNAASLVYVIYGIVFLAAGFYLLRGAPGLMQFSYPAKPPAEQSRETNNP